MPVIQVFELSLPISNSIKCTFKWIDFSSELKDGRSPDMNSFFAFGMFNPFENISHEIVRKLLSKIANRQDSDKV